MVEAARDHGLLDPVLSRSMTRLWARMWLLRFTWRDMQGMFLLGLHGLGQLSQARWQ